MDLSVTAGLKGLRSIDMYRFGLKLWSENTAVIPEAEILFKKGVCSYIELYSVPGSYDEVIASWRGVEVPFIVHAPHFSGGMNLAEESAFYKNMVFAEESKRFADALKSEIIIFHPGVNGRIDESIRQFKNINDPRIVVENKPYWGLRDEKCIGYSPEEIRFIMDETGFQFCLDFGHAICSANAQKLDRIKYVKEFLRLNPVMYHLTDGDYDSLYDSHDRYGEGSFPLEVFLSFIPENSMITNEARKDLSRGLGDFEMDIKKIGLLV